jgi:hypothetical protein
VLLAIQTAARREFPFRLGRKILAGPLGVDGEALLLAKHDSLKHSPMLGLFLFSAIFALATSSALPSQLRFWMAAITYRNSAGTGHSLLPFMDHASTAHSHLTPEERKNLALRNDLVSMCVRPLVATISFQRRNGASSTIGGLYMATKDEEARKRRKVAKRMNGINEELRRIEKKAMKIVMLSHKLSEEGRGLDTYHIADGTQFSRWAIVANSVSRDAWEFKDLAKMTRDYVDKYVKEPPEAMMSNGTPMDAKTRH